MRHLAAVELEIAFAREQQRVIDGLGPVHEFGRARGEFGDPYDGALARADVVVAGDEPFALRGVGGFRIVGRHPIGRPDFAAGDVRSSQPAGGREAFVGFDDRLAVGVVPGDDAPYFQSHGCPPLVSLGIG